MQLDGCVAAQSFDDPFDQGQSEPTVDAGVGSGGIAPPEAVEDVGDLPVAEFASGVGDGDFDDPVCLMACGPDASGLVGIFDGVFEEIGEYHCKALRVGLTGDFGVELIFKRDAPVKSYVGVGPPAGVYHSCDFDSVGLEGHLVGVNMGQRQEVVHHGLHVLGYVEAVGER